MLISQVHSACWIKQTQGHGINLPTQRKLCFILSLAKPVQSKNHISHWKFDR